MLAHLHARRATTSSASSTAGAWRRRGRARQAARRATAARRAASSRWTSACSPSARWPRTASSSAATTRTPALIIDPGEEADRILGTLEQLGISKLEAILLTHTHFDHIGAVAPVAKATGAPVYCPEIEIPVLADIMAYIPWQGFGPYESWDAEETVCRRRAARARRLRDRRRLHPRAQPRPRHLLDPGRARAVLRRRPLPGLGRAHGPAVRRLADAPRLDPQARSSRFPDETGSTQGTWGSRRSAPSARRTRSLPSSPLDVRLAARWRRFKAPRGHVRRPARRLGGARRACSPPPRALFERAGYGRIETPVFEETELFARGRRGVHRHRPEGDVHLRRPGRAQPHPPARGHRADLPRLRRARHAQASAAGEALVLGPVLPPRAPAGGPLPPVPPDRRSRRSAPTHRWPTPRRSSCSTSSCASSPSPACALRLGSLGSPDARAAYRDELRAYLRAQRSGALRRRSRRGSTRTRCVPSTRTTRARAR